MKKITFLMVLIVLGATTFSCNDQDFSDVEKSVMNVNTDASIDDDNQAKAKPGG